MINLFRSVALNVSAAGLTNPYSARNIHIDPAYSTIPLPADLALLYNTFYPSANLESKLQLTQAYLALIEGCGLTDATLSWDPRITYKIVRPDEPQNLRSISVGIPTTVAAENPDIAFRVFNYNYKPSWLVTPLTRTLSIEQQTNTLVVAVYEGPSLITTKTLVFSGGYSDYHEIPDPANTKGTLFGFQIKHPTSPAFTATSGKKWEVTFSIGYSELIPRQFAEMKRQTNLISGLMSTYRLATAKPYDELWLKHFNEAYRLAGLYIGMVYRIYALSQQRNSQTDGGLVGWSEV
ncbi:hypothetical protein EKK58_01375 [Candidatus Dependentiae bacterium]|nr:MAG: hypothetical protein EKK58_01375 [Candidatus Dependentiae bacterium]